MLIAAATAAVLVLLLQGPVRAAEPDPALEAQRWLEERAPLGASERLEAAERVLERGSRQRLRDVNASALETGTRLWMSASPYGVARSAYRLGRRLAGLRERAAAEDSALDWLEPGVRAGPASPELLARYQELRDRERRALARRKLEEATEARDDGHRTLARLRAERALEIWPLDTSAHELLEELSRAGQAGGAIAPEETLVTSLDEVAIATALLRDDAAAARALAPADRTGSLAHGVLEYLEGDHERALQRFAELSEGDDATAELARRWLADPEIDLAGALQREERSYRVRRALGWVGGAPLASRGLELSSESYRAWRSSLRPLNLALSVPSRMWTGFEPAETSALRGTASSYLEALPDGPLALRASSWLDRLADPALSLFDDGALVLPAAATSYDTLLVEPVIVTRRALDHGLFEEGALLGDVLGDARAIVLLPREGGHDLQALRGDSALAVLGELSRGLERGEFSARGRGGFATLEALRRLENAVREGASLRARAYAAEGPQLGLRRTLIDGGSSRASGGVDVVRDGEELQLSRRMVSEGFPCPAGSVCIDRDPLFDATLFGKIEADADGRIGAEGRLLDSRLSLEISTEGAQAEIVLPLTQWLGVERWLPFDARFGVGTEGLHVLPRPRHQDDDEARSWELGIRKDF
jgi:hypothetical protein